MFDDLFELKTSTERDPFMMSTETQNYYEILDIKPDASQNDIRQAYLRVKAAYSKDSAALYSLFDEHETKKMLSLVEEAFIILSNVEKRKEYDRVHGFLSSSPAALEKVPEAAPSNTRQSFSFKEERLKEDTEHSETKTRRFDNPSEPQDKDSPFNNEENTNPSFEIKENRLGIIRRTELLKDLSPSQDLIREISEEKEFRGSFFRKIREQYRVSLDELSEFTKISKNYLSCLESEEFESLPAPPYVRGFVVQVAKALKLPHEIAARGYMNNYKNHVK